MTDKEFILYVKALMDTIPENKVPTVTECSNVLSLIRKALKEKSKSPLKNLWGSTV